MKKVGLVGGIGPASTVNYYLGLIERTKKEFGEHVYPEIVIDSVDMDYATKCFENNEDEKSVKYMIQSVENLKNAGAKIAAITANTEHILWDKMVKGFSIPVVSIVDAAIEEICVKGYQRVLVLGTVFTMNSGMYDRKLSAKGVVPILPSDEDKKMIGNLIYPNLENGIVIPEDRMTMINLTERYIEKERVDAVLLGCTEIALAIKESDLSKPVLDTTKIHIEAIFKKMCE